MASKRVSRSASRNAATRSSASSRARVASRSRARSATSAKVAKAPSQKAPRANAGGARAAGAKGAAGSGAAKPAKAGAGAGKAGGVEGKASRGGVQAAGTRPAKAKVAGNAEPGVLMARMFHVDAFTSRLFHGNPAAVVPLKKWPSDQTLQAIAAENNLAETAFFLYDDSKPPKGGKAASKREPTKVTLPLRWFTPTLEMDLCGHATLASAHVLWTHLGLQAERIVFESRSGPLIVERDHGMIEMDFPSRPGKPVPVTVEMSAACGREPVEAYLARDLMLVFDNRRDVYEMKPDMARIAALPGFGVIVTAPGSGHDFVSRFFAPNAGVPEDPVTGSAHCTLAPYWAERLRCKRLFAHQVSRRGGELRCDVDEGRVRLAGHAVTFSEGVIRLGA
ncbi:MAG: PhzF family phenazine biosynthesis protein [Planctomycetota bacterium]|nr:PhzF family phenazine biosynthesis protein [Planctomycetota bacterium]